MTEMPKLIPFTGRHHHDFNVTLYAYEGLIPHHPRQHDFLLSRHHNLGESLTLVAGSEINPYFSWPVYATKTWRNQ